MSAPLTRNAGHPSKLCEHHDIGQPELTKKLTGGRPINISNCTKKQCPNVLKSALTANQRQLSTSVRASPPLLSWSGEPARSITAVRVHRNCCPGLRSWQRRNRPYQGLGREQPAAKQEYKCQGKLTFSLIAEKPERCEAEEAVDDEQHQRKVPARRASLRVKSLPGGGTPNLNVPHEPPKHPSRAPRRLMTANLGKSKGSSPLFRMQVSGNSPEIVEGVHEGPN
eukprot:1781018-Rhodomonas_salina.1